ncbi:formate dehydrogenase accessory sulfurtransferase FdhD [Paenibacillus thermotolerans]|uniref:formate dehydrogenase accessory sulfurtransferase FdhD n=1 Tax=Paenibacillus thermotolerans TaxID=3027807 RepID=UPI002367D4F3|nr:MULTISPECIES: formate dehydrogenase accessory sulfurtransferase FdhD [unclassified Paenibacillus]
MNAPDKVKHSRKIVRYDGNALLEETDAIAVEYPLTIVVDGEEFATMVCTPTELQELVIGFLASEGIIRRPGEIQSIRVDEGRGFAYIELLNKKSAGVMNYSKRFIGSCCGKSRQFYFHNDMRTAKTVTSKSVITVEQCFAFMERLMEQSSDFRMTGGVHNAALCGKEGVVAVRTDIGRHNALDKLFGHCLLNRIPIHDKVLTFSGRLSSEVLLKAAKIGVGIVLSKSAPTTLAIDLAHDLGITAVGFIRGRTLNVYTHPERISCGAGS